MIFIYITNLPQGDWCFIQPPLLLASDKESPPSEKNVQEEHQRKDLFSRADRYAFYVCVQNAQQKLQRERKRKWGRLILI